MFHYHPDTMSTYGVSRLRASEVSDTPLGAQLFTLVPVATPEGVVAYVAADTDGHNDLLAWCSAPRWQGSKVFLVSDKACLDGVEGNSNHCRIRLAL